MLGFLIAAAAGYLTPQLEENAAPAVIKGLSKHIEITGQEKRLVAFMIALLAAAALSSLLDSGGIVVVSLGVVLGYFGKRIVAAVQKFLDDRKSV